MIHTAPELHIYGSPKLVIGANVVPLERKDAALLAVLTLEGATARDSLAAWLWPAVPLKQANLSLRQRVFRLRRKSGHELLHTGLTLSLVESVVVSGADQTEATGELLAGMAYADCPELADWLRQQRELQGRLRRDAMAQRAAAQEAAGELAAAINTAQRLLAEDALSDHALRRLMRLHYLRGDRTAAVAAFERFERHLKDELGARPDPETVAMLNTVESSAGGPAPALHRMPVPASLLRPPRLVGRQTEMAALVDAWALARVPLLLGEAGVGKTRLLAEFAQGYPEAVRVQARPGDAGVPFALLARWLRGVQQRIKLPAAGPHAGELARVLPEWANPPLAGGEGQRLALQAAVEWLLLQAAGRQCTQTLLDDLHFADEASLEMLQSLVCSERLAGLQWGLAMRPADGPPAAAALRAALQEDQRLHTVVLQPLNLAAVQEMLSSLALPALDATAMAAPLLKHTGGNPLFLLETLKDMVLSGPGAAARLPQPTTVSALIERRLEALSPPALTLARVAAVAGVDFGIELAAAVLGKPALDLADAWRELGQAQVLAGGVFAHDLVFEATLRTLPDEIARHVHGCVADVLRRRDGPPARIAQHLASAWRWAEAAQHFECAAGQARSVSRLDEAASFFARAFSCLECSAETGADSFRLRGLHVEALIETERWPEAIAAATALPDRAHSAPERVLALTLHGRALFAAGDHVAAMALGEQALAVAEQVGDADLIARAAYLRAMAGCVLHDAELAAERMLALRPWVVTLGDTDERWTMERDIGLALFHAHRSREALPLLQACAARGEGRGDLAELGHVALVMGMCRFRLGDAQGAEVDLRRSVLARRASLGDDGPGLPIAAVVLATVQRCLGDFGEAVSTLETIRPRVAAVSGILLDRVDAELGFCWFWLGQTQRVQQALRELASRSRDGVVRGLGASLELEQALWSDLEVAAALSHFRLASEGIEDQLDQIELDWREAAAAPGASDRLAALEGRASGAGLVAMARAIAASRVERLRRDGHLQAATAAAAELSPAIAEGLASTQYPPQAWLQCIDAQMAAGESTAALQTLAMAREWILEKALPHVPEPFRESFLVRNPVNRRLLALRLV